MSVWKGVKRVFVNCDGDRRKLLPPARFEVERGADEVGENEERIFVEEDKTWVMEECDVEWFKQAFTTFEFGGKIEDSEEKWMELEESLGGKDSKLGYWFIYLLKLRSKQGSLCAETCWMPCFIYEKRGMKQDDAAMCALGGVTHRQSI